jgi:hypothetical protein
MAYSALLAVSTDIWIAIVVPIVLCLLVVGPVLAVSLRGLVAEPGRE